MDFKITDVAFYKHPPNTTIVDDILVAYGASLAEIRQALRTYDFVRQKTYQGFQIELGKQLGNLFADLFENKGLRVYTQPREARYSPTIDLRADLVVKGPAHARGIYIEIEFRPNEYKDIVKFEIGHRRRLMELGILVVAQHREHINPDYTTMPEFVRCAKLVAELEPRCPVLLIGIDGEAS